MSDVYLICNLSSDPELRFTPAGKAVCTFSVAENDKPDANGESKAHFYRVTCWNSLAENVSESLAKGTRIILKGRLEQNRWETNEGDKRDEVRIVAWNVGPDLSWATADVRKNERSN